MGRYKTKLQAIQEANKRILNESKEEGGILRGVGGAEGYPSQIDMGVINIVDSGTERDMGM